MRSLMRRKRAITYKDYAGVVYDTDANGRKTGHKSVQYSQKKTLICTVSAPTGNATLEMFGVNENYDRVIVVDDPNFPISETSVLWIETPYSEGVAHDYVIKRIIRNINYMAIGCRKVDVCETNIN